MSSSNTAFLFIGFQNDYFASDGILRPVIEESERTQRVLENSLELIETYKNTQALMIQTPIIFTKDYSELINPVGILKTIIDVKAFNEDSPGSATIPEFQTYGDRILTVAGKRGLNAFSNTSLHQVLKAHNIERVVLSGVVTSICIDSTGRAAHELGYQVTVLSDCTASRTPFEQSFYCDQVFPLYADVITSSELIHTHSIPA